MFKSAFNVFTGTLAICLYVLKSFYDEPDDVFKGSKCVFDACLAYNSIFCYRRFYIRAIFNFALKDSKKIPYGCSWLVGRPDIVLF